jgi:adenylate cyclase
LESEKPRRTSISEPRRKFLHSIPIASALALSFGSLVVVAVLVVLGISLISGFANTRDLLIDKANSAMNATRGDLTDLLDPAEEQVRYIADLIYSGVIDVNNSNELSDFLLGGLAGTPQIASLTYISPSFEVTAASRKTKRIINVDTSNDPIGKRIFADVSAKQEGHWGPLIFIPKLDETVINFRQPVIKDGQFMGAIFATIPVSAVNEKLRTARVIEGGTRFVLYGRNNVLLQHTADRSQIHITEDGVVPTLDEIEDPILKNIWSPRKEPLNILSDTANYQGHHLTVQDEGYLYFYSNLAGYSDKDFIIGFWIRNDEAGAEIFRLAIAGLAGLVIMLFSALLAFIIGRKIARPILALSVASQKISDLEFEKVGVLPGSRFQEVNEANEAYNTMIRGLTWFETYVPRSLVRKLMETGEARSEQRAVTVMFTDIVGFTPQAENMNSDEVASFLNHHFELVTSCIEAEGGTIDKFIGDAVMAFWGAPEIQEDHAARACRAAIAIRKAIMADNKKRVSANLEPVKMRIGIHTGQLVVGNIGSKGRMNYTVVGDTVNIAQRMEQLGKSVSGESPEEVFTLITDTTCLAAGKAFSVDEIGEHSVKGRTHSVKIYHLK